MSSGELSLNPRYVWVDVWLLEDIIDHADAAWSNSRTQEALRLMERALDLYRGPFLSQDTEAPWSFSPRDRIHGNFIRHVEKLGDHLEKAGEQDQAVKYYEKVLVIDDTAERIYRRLMVCYKVLGQVEKALEAYERCKKALSAVAGSEPSPETKTLFRSFLA